jgi:hypothetical protein
LFSPILLLGLCRFPRRELSIFKAEEITFPSVFGTASKDDLMRFWIPIAFSLAWAATAIAQEKGTWRDGEYEWGDLEQKPRTIREYFSDFAFSQKKCR